MVCSTINFKELDLEFHIYGSGNELEKVEEFLIAHPNNGIKYLGVIARDQIPVVLAEYDAMLVSLVKNIYGAVPSKIYEAMAAGLPIVFSGEGEGAIIIEDNGLGWTSKPADWYALKENLRSLKNITNDTLYGIKDKVQKVADEKFNRKQQVQRFHEELIRSK